MKNSFDARKRNLGTEPVVEDRHLKRWLIYGIAACLTVAALAVIATSWYLFTHVRTVRASVQAAVINLASDVDARMQELYVEAGQEVVKGQALARLDDSALRASLAAAEAERAIKISQIAQIEAQARVIVAQIESDIEVAKAKLEMARRRLAAAQVRLDMKKKRIPEEVRGAQAYRDEASARLQYLIKGARKEEIEVAKARLATAQAREALRKYQVEQIRTLVERRVESPLELQVIQTELLAQHNEVREAQLRLQQLEAGPTTDQIEQARQALEAREAALTLAKGLAEEVPVTEAELAIRKAELTEAESALRQAEAKRHEVAVARERVKAAEAELQRAQADIDERSALLKRMTLVSPVTGTVIRTFDDVGEICRKGIPSIMVSDDAKGRWIEGFVHEDEARLLKVGQRASVELVLGSGDYVQARVESVALATSAISRTEASSNQSGTAEMVWVKLRPLSDIGNVRPGMSASAVIRVRTDERLSPDGEVVAATLEDVRVPGAAHQ